MATLQGNFVLLVFGLLALLRLLRTLEAPLRSTPAKHPCEAPLRSTPAKHPCEAPLRSTPAKHEDNLPAHQQPIVWEPVAGSPEDADLRDVPPEDPAVAPAAPGCAGLGGDAAGGAPGP
ncbi:MAG: hypothetical protein M1823_005593 [Watsoniomyces obsoletus]|nr:MAG: hypothetical protein M1823_005593 [Watsoniomyces obsoletus]